MNKVVQLTDYKKEMNYYDKKYSLKLCRIRDMIENELTKKTIEENDPLAISLAAGRYAAMKLEKIIGQEDAMKFFKDCIKTSKNNI